VLTTFLVRVKVRFPIFTLLQHAATNIAEH